MSFCKATPSHLFIDLATFSEPEGFIYGGPEAISWFVAAVQKSNWFSYLPIQLRQSGLVDFGCKDVCASVNRSGDYVLHIWFRAQIPQIQLVQDGTIFVDASLRWTNNLMHNLFEDVCITFNELTVQEFDNFWLDNNFQFRKSAAKRGVYRNMIGDVASFTNAQAVGSTTPVGTGGYLSVPFPFWFTEDTGIALPVAALPFNDVKVNYSFRRWEDLVIIYPGTAGAIPPIGPGRVATVNDVFVYGSTTQKPNLRNATTNAHYAVVHNDERVKMGDAPRDILITQVQNTQCAPLKDLSSDETFDIRLSHSIVLFCFETQNVSLLQLSGGSGGGEWSNYTTVTQATQIPLSGSDPIEHATLVYDNTVRLDQGADYYSWIFPDLLSEAAPDRIGFHMWSYSFHPWSPLEVSGSTNYSKLSNVSMTIRPSVDAQHAAGINTVSGRPEDSDGAFIQWPDSTGTLQDFPQQFRFIFRAKNWNLGRVANGSFGHPTL